MKKVIGSKKSAGTVIKKKSPAKPANLNLSVKNDCICETMAPHCPIHAVHKVPAPGCDVIR